MSRQRSKQDPVATMVLERRATEMAHLLPLGLDFSLSADARLHEYAPVGGDGLAGAGAASSKRSWLSAQARRDGLPGGQSRQPVGTLGAGWERAGGASSLKRVRRAGRGRRSRRRIEDSGGKDGSQRDSVRTCRCGARVLVRVSPEVGSSARPALPAKWSVSPHPCAHHTQAAQIRHHHWK